MRPTRRILVSMEDQLHTHETFGFVANCPACDHVAMVLQAKNLEGALTPADVLEMNQLLAV